MQAGDGDHVDADPTRIVDDVDTRGEAGRRLELGHGSGPCAGQLVPESFAEETQYRMNHHKRGVAIIINNKTFDPRTQMGVRNGTDTDATSLYSIFRSKMGFESVRKYDNITAGRMLSIMEEAAKIDYTIMDCFACAILTHGEEGRVYGTDKDIPLDDLVAPFKKCKTLAGKPKIFLIQACRGTKLDDGMDMEQPDGPMAEHHREVDLQMYRIPTEADFLMAYSVVPGYFSWRNSRNGSWFIQALAEEMENPNATEIELVNILTRVNRRVAYQFQSNAADRRMTNKKQIPCITSMLTKELYFPRKY